MNKYLLGFAIASFLLAMYTIYLLSKKDTVENNYEIENLKQKNKRNKQSKIDNDISARIEEETPKKRPKQRKNGILKRLLIKRKRND